MGKTDHTREPKDSSARQRFRWRREARRDNRRRREAPPLVVDIEPDAPLTTSETGYFPVSTWDEAHRENVHWEREGKQGVDYDVEEPLPDWERVLLAMHVADPNSVAILPLHDSTDDRHVRECADCCHEMVVREGLYPDDEPWRADRPEDYFDDDLDDPVEHRSDFLPLLTVPQLFAELGDGWVIEHSYADALVPPKSQNYIRVWELARLCGIPAADMVRRLRLMGEYVECAQSMVARVVGQNVLQSHARDEVQQFFEPPYAEEEASVRAITELRERLTRGPAVRFDSLPDSPPWRS